MSEDGTWICKNAWGQNGHPCQDQAAGGPGFYQCLACRLRQLKEARPWHQGSCLYPVQQAQPSDHTPSPVPSSCLECRPPLCSYVCNAAIQNGLACPVQDMKLLSRAWSQSLFARQTTEFYGQSSDCVASSSTNSMPSCFDWAGGRIWAALKKHVDGVIGHELYLGSTQGTTKYNATFTHSI